jgi:hypothetical protein
MLKSLIAAAAAVALTAGVALAQDETTTHEKTVVQNPDGSTSVQASKTQTATDAFGNQATEKKSFSKTDDGVNRRVTRSVETEAPTGATTSTSETTTVGR